MPFLGDETERKNLQKILELLNKAAFCIQKSRTQEQIFSVTAEKLKQLNFHVVFWLLNEEKTAGRIAHVTAAESLKNINMKGIPLSEVEFPIGGKLYKNSVNKKESVYIKKVKAAIRGVPPDLQEISEKVINFLGIANKKAVVAPLLIHDETIGLLAVISDTITEDDIPSIHAFANQVSSALENAQLHQESRKRTDELARKLREQELLRELNTNLFLAQTRDDVLDAAIEGIHTLGQSFSNISLLNEKKTHSKIVRVKMDQKLLKAVEKMGKKVIPGFTLLGYEIPVTEEGNIYHKFYENQLPLITPNIDLRKHSVMKADLSEFYLGLARKERIFQDVTKAASTLLPYKSIMAFPIVVGKHTVGTLSVTGEGVFSQEDFELMQTVGEMVSGAMERVIHAEKLMETINELRAVQKINTLMNTGASLEQILVQICTSIKEVYYFRFAYPLLLDSSGKYLNLTYLSLPPQIGKKLNKVFGLDFKKFKYPLAEGSFYYNHIIRDKKCVIVKGVEGLAEEIQEDTVKKAMKNLSPLISRLLFGSRKEENNIMVAPLPYGEEVIGVLILGHRKSLTEKDFQRLEHFLDQVGIAIAKSDVESRLRQSLEELRELDQMKSEFIDIASHELRTPLTTLKLYLEMILLEQYGILSEPVRKRLTIMEDGVNRLEEIINQTLVASRLIKNKLELEKTPVSLLKITTDVIHQLRPLWQAKNQDIFVESSPHISLVEGDAKALSTVVNNVVDNAIRYSPKGTDILIRFVEHPEEVECMVIDQGQGIPPEYMEKIFEEFYIVPSKTEYARMDGRTGLGLFIARGIINRHEGRIWVESTSGEGSTFHFTLRKCGKVLPNGKD